MDGLPIGNQRSIDDFDIRAVEADERRPDHRMMRSGKTEDAMAAASVIGIACGYLRNALAVVDTKLETRRGVLGLGRQGEACKDDQ